MIKQTLCLVFVLLGCSLYAQYSNRPNILWIVSEDNSPFLGCYGDSFATTPNLDRLAEQGVLYKHAFATAPVCAPSRSTLITGMYPPSLGTENMRSNYPVPQHAKFYATYLREAGYYTSNNSKKDYNTVDQPQAWDESSAKATYKNRPDGKPFFAIFNLTVSHESAVHKPISDAALKHDPKRVPIPPYHPRTKEMEHDWAQYYDKVEQMDAQVGRILKELEESGLAENTIVFYYSDHGGVLGRSKRFLFESGLKIPLIIRFPEKWRGLAPGSPGSQTDRIVSFLDFAPTLLSLTGIPIPEHMQGSAFLGAQQGAEHSYAYGFRGRMDERIDLSRTIRNKKYRYIRNYMPHKIYGQYLEYLWRAPSMASWEREYNAGRLNEVQNQFWQEKPAEELYDIEKDPHNIHNLASDPGHAALLKVLRKENHDWLLKSRDIGFVPEPMLLEISKSGTPFDFGQSPKYSLERILETAEMASSRDASFMGSLRLRLKDSDPVVRYWAVIGAIIQKDKSAQKILTSLLKDQEVSVRIAAAEAVFGLGDINGALKVLKQVLKSDNQMARVYALNVLEQMGEDARPALDEVKILLKDNPGGGDYDVRAAERLVELLGM
ncbi:sulfatase-like hydrolase/transferase [Dyadobacter tibetensis]|uniref:sulfatase-like hydrolase/transferase n=1 Tax=Dyadobacter tibetensis TaxID=1211851 RepID=UPI00047248D8|nr:sulfatase-like hydrolase/transferase [Dyadobacter tibetensis]